MTPLGLLILALLLLSGCVKDVPPNVTTVIPDSKAHIFVICEGNYGTGDASLYEYFQNKDSAYGDLYAVANGQKLGDVLQSMMRIGSDFYLVVNNSNKIIVVDATTFKAKKTVAIPQPRYILPVTATKAYVSALYSNKIYVLNTQSYTITDTIILPTKSSEGMCLYNGNVFVCSWDTAANHFYQIDGTTNQIIHSILLPGYAPQDVLIDKDQMLWVLAGDQPEGKIATLSRIDPSTGEILKSFTFPTQADPLHPVFNNTKDTLYFIEANYYNSAANNGVFRMSIYDNTLPVQPFVTPGSLQYYWALGIDKLTGNIFVGDPKGFRGAGEVYVYRSNCILIDSFKVGVGPGHFYFDE